MAGDHLRLLRRRTIPFRDLHRNPALLVDEHGWPEEKKDRLKSLNLEGWADRQPHGRIDSLLSGFVAPARTRYSSKSVFAVSYCVGAKHALRLLSSAVKGALAFRPVSLTLPSKL